MKCPFCGELSDRVVDSREVRDASIIRRRRECQQCSRRYTTYERIEEVHYMIVKRDGRRERFDRAKLMTGLIKACEKRPIKISALEALVDDVEAMLQERIDREITSEEVGNHVVVALRDLDQVAYVRFASVYRRFEDVQEFMGELQELLHTKSAVKDPPRRS